MNRGSDRDAGNGHDGHRGFNEAPIHESGKSALVRFSRAANCRFNEAPIHESGKFRSAAARRKIIMQLQ